MSNICPLATSYKHYWMDLMKILPEVSVDKEALIKLDSGIFFVI